MAPRMTEAPEFLENMEHLCDHELHRFSPFRNCALSVPGRLVAKRVQGGPRLFLQEFHHRFGAVVDL
jgi:hypothetical protein